MKKKKIDPIKEAEKARHDADRMEQMSLATRPSHRTHHEDREVTSAPSTTNTKKS